MAGPDYLSGERFYLRAPIKTDAETASAWYPGVFPVGSSRAESYLKDHLKAAWWPGRELHLMLVRADDDAVVGGVIAERPTGPGAVATFRLAASLTLEEADDGQAEALRLLIPWLLNEAEVLTVTASIAVDQPRSLEAAASIGMTVQIRLREFLARPGGRVDLLQLQALNPRRMATVEPAEMVDRGARGRT